MRGILKVEGTLLLILVAILLSACNKDEEPVKASFNTVFGFVIDEYGTKFLASDGGLYAFDKNGWRLISLNHQDQISNLNGLALESPEAQLQKLWIATDGGALDQTSGTILTSANSGLLNDMVYHLCFDNMSSQFFATADGVSVNFDGSWHETTGNDDLFLNYEMTGIATATNAYTYVPTLGGGVGRFKTDVDGISGATIFDSDWTSLETNNILTVFVMDTLQWYGTDRGVAVHYSEYTKWDWETFSVSDGLISDTVKAIVKDNADNIWFGTPRGISSFDGANWTSYTMKSHDLISDNIDFLALDVDGSVWAASGSGLSKFSDNVWVSYSK